MENRNLEIEKILVEIDPVRLICMGAPDDEYSSEAIMIQDRTNKSNTTDQIHVIVYDIFVEQFGGVEHAHRIIGTFDSYKIVAERIKKLLGD
jgi:hypothetical protein